MSEIGKNLNRAMAVGGVTQRSLARTSGVDQAQISRLLTDRVENPAIDTVAALAKGLRTTVGALLGEAPAARPGDERLLPHADILPSPLNPRKLFDEAELKELADNVAERGILQNLVARPHAKKPGKFELAAGERRWRAVGLLIADGRWPRDRLIPVRVLALTDYDLIFVGASENVQRRSMHPLEEGAAFAALLAASKESENPEARAGVTKNIAKAFGKTQRWVQQRIALDVRLADPVKKAFLDGKIDLEAAKAYSLAPAKTQASILKHSGHDADPRWIRHQAAEKMAPVGANLFPLERYTGEIVEDPDAGPREPKRYFADVDAFRELQADAIAERMAALQAKWAWVKRIDGYWGDQWRYAKSKDKTKAGAVLIVHGVAVEVHEGLIEKKEGKAEAGRRRGRGEESKPPPEPVTQAHLAEAKRRKTAAMQAAIVAQGPVAAMRLVCLALMGGEGAVRIQAIRHSPEECRPAAAVADALKPFAAKLGARFQPDRGDRPLRVSDFHVGGGLETGLWAKLARLDAENLARLFAALVAARTGSFTYNPSVAGDRPAAAAIAATLGLAHGAVAPDGAAAFVLDEAWLKGYRKPALLAAAVASRALTEAEAAKLESKPAARIRAEVLASATRDPTWIPAELRFQAAADEEDDGDPEWDEDEDDGAEP